MIAIVANPNALNFSSSKLKHVLNILSKNGLKADVFFTQKADDGIKIATLLDGKYRIIAAYGGDGIINEIINGDIKSSAIAVLPAGTTNVLAIELFGRSSLKLATRALLKGNTKKAWVAKINSRRFILMAGAGFDAESVYWVNEKRKKAIGKLEYILSGVKAYVFERAHCFTININNAEYRALWAIISNAKKYAGHFNISNKTNIFDGKLDIFLCPCGKRVIELPYCNGALFGGLHNYIPFVKHLTTNQAIKITGQPHIQIDGDYFEKTDATIQLQRTIDIVIP